jgi:Flp pilus assembly protein TadD
MKTLPIIFVFFISGVFPVTSISAQIQKEGKSSSVQLQDIKKLLLPETSEQSEQEKAELLLNKEIIANDLIKKAFKETNYNEKIRLYKKALELTPDNPDAYNNLGVIYKKMKMYNLAINSYKKALKIPGYHTPEHQSRSSL